MIYPKASSLPDSLLSFSFSRNSLDPDLAIVPRLSMASFQLIPIPESKIDMVLSLSLVLISILKSYPALLCYDRPLNSLNFYFSRASLQFDNSSLKNTSLSVYIDFATIFKSFFVSALNYFVS